MDDEDIRQYRQRRESFLTIMLTLIAAGGILLFLTIITSGFFLYVLVGLAAIALFGSLHYVLWGRLFMRQMGAERAEEVRRTRDEDEPWFIPEDERRVGPL